MGKRINMSVLFFLIGIGIVFLAGKEGLKISGKMVSSDLDWGEDWNGCDNDYHQIGTSENYHRPKLSKGGVSIDLLKHCILARLDAGRLATNICYDGGPFCRVTRFKVDSVKPAYEDFEYDTFTRCEVYVSFSCVKED